jgi:hypothetical protein
MLISESAGANEDPASLNWGPDADTDGDSKCDRICLWRFDFGERPKRRAKLFWRLGLEPAIPNGQACHGYLTVSFVFWGAHPIVQGNALRRVMAVFDK